MAQPSAANPVLLCWCLLCSLVPVPSSPSATHAQCIPALQVTVPPFHCRAGDQLTLCGDTLVSCTGGQSPTTAPSRQHGQMKCQLSHIPECCCGTLEDHSSPCAWERMAAGTHRSPGSFVGWQRATSAMSCGYRGWPLATCSPKTQGGAGLHRQEQPVGTAWWGHSQVSPPSPPALHKGIVAIAREHAWGLGSCLGLGAVASS